MANPHILNKILQPPPQHCNNFPSNLFYNVLSNAKFIERARICKTWNTNTEQKQIHNTKMDLEKYLLEDMTIPIPHPQSVHDHMAQ